MRRKSRRCLSAELEVSSGEFKGEPVLKSAGWKPSRWVQSVEGASRM